MSYVSYSQLGNNGRLGNGLFQLGALIAYCKKYNKTPMFPNWKYLNYFKNLPAPTADIPKFKLQHVEASFHYCDIVFIGEDFEMTGYFQSWRYTESVDVNKLFELKDEYKKQVDDLYNGILKEISINKGLYNETPISKTVSIHVRRSDYLNPGTNEYHGILGMDYYNRAISALCSGSLDDVLFIVCSDDIGWCMENFKHLKNVYFSVGENEITDLYLMSLCDSIVMANSSFSWWAARLGDKNKGKVAPSNWFGPAGKHNNPKDLYFPNTIII